jgi:hypothetical protein
MIVKQNVTVYQCEFCKKKRFREWAMEIHEERCHKNPVNWRPCFECCHLEMKEVDVNWQDYNGHDHDKIVKLFFCSALKHCLISPQTAIKGNAVYSDDMHPLTNEHMPLTCEHQNEETLPF